MEAEEMLRDFILSKYGSVLEFTQSIDMPYATLQSIFRRGIQNSSVTNIIKICRALGISADELAKGKIVPIDLMEYLAKEAMDMENMILYTRQNIAKECIKYSIDGKPLSEIEAGIILDAIEFSVAVIKKTR